VPLAPPVRPRRRVAGLGGEAGAHGWRPMGSRQHGGAQSWGRRRSNCCSGAVLWWLSCRV
jgi:hypothetical protein